MKTTGKATLAILACALALHLCACTLPGSLGADAVESEADQGEVQVAPDEAAEASHDKDEKREDKPQELVAKPLDEYTWAELTELSARIADAASDEEGRAIAQEFGLVESDGTLSRQTKMIVLNNTRALDVRLAGIRHDDKADGSGKAGITFMTVGALDIRPMNQSGTIEGGWEASELRAWLASEVPPMLDEDLSQAIVPVRKLTNNRGISVDQADVTPTEDRLWLFSVPEVCGEVHWDVEEYKQLRGYEDIDGMINAEGWQYEAFAREGVSYKGDPNGFLSLASSTGSSPWWYRTPYPFDWVGYGDTGATGYFCRVMPSGYPESLGSPEDPSSVVVGFCV